MPGFNNIDEKPLYSTVADSDIDSNESLLKEEDISNIPYEKRRAWIIISFHGLLVFANCFILMMYKISHPVGFRDLETSIAADAIEFETRFYPHISNASGESPYAGKPRKEVQTSWLELRKYADITIPEKIMADLDRLDEGIRLPDGSGYLGTLNVYHELHCVEQMYRWLYKDIYIPDITPQEHEDQISHLEHCLEALRESVQCHADLSFISYKWGHKQAVPLANWNSPHVCKNWDAIQDWSKQHYVEHLKDPGWLIHPKFGPAYGNNISRIGVVHDV